MVPDSNVVLQGSGSDESSTQAYNQILLRFLVMLEFTTNPWSSFEISDQIMCMQNPRG